MTSLEQQLENANKLVAELKEQIRHDRQSECGLLEDSAQDLDHYGEIKIKNITAKNGSFSEGINFFTKLQEGSIRMSVAVHPTNGKQCLKIYRYTGVKWELLQRFA